MKSENKRGHKSNSYSEGNAPADKNPSSIRIRRISSLLSELAELMRQERLGKEAIHHVHQLQMRVQFAAYNPRTVADEIPAQAPAKWSKRDKKNESPVDFIRREYADWIGKGLTRAHLRRLDMTLYDALNHWLKSNELPSEIDLPTKTELIDRKIAQAGLGSISFSSQPEKLRLYRAARRRAAKKGYSE